MSKQKKKQKPSFKVSNTNPAGSIDKPVGHEDIPGISDDTRVVYSQEHNRYGDMDDG